MIRNKWLQIIFRTIGLIVMLIGMVTDNWYLKLAFLPFLYLFVLSVRNNYAWYFYFEFAILAVFLLGAFLINRLPGIALWCLFSGIGLSILYMIIVFMMNARGYPVKKLISEENDEIK
ncbi:MAG: hypothetical protein K0Q99_1332 [Clostridia bacterium]|jgi:hypothetical protein|nr:hypothetical protein [Clostridia bacterium]